MNHALQDLFNNPLIKKLSAPSLVASALASIIHPLLAAIGFELPAAMTALTQAGFKIAAELLPTMIEAAKKGILTLSDWLEKELKKPEVNESAAQTMVEQAVRVSQTMQETHPDDKDEIAEILRQGFESYGGAMSEIAEQYAAAMKNAAELNQLIEQMRGKLETRSSQSVEAKRGSTVEDVEMRIKGSSGDQKISARDKSKIKKVKQIIE